VDVEMKRFLFLALGLAPVAASAVVLYEQNPLAVDGLISDAHPFGTNTINHQSIREEFSVPGGWLLQEVKFWGASENRIHADLTNFRQFAVKVWRTDGQLVMSLGYTMSALQYVPTGQVGVNGAIGYEFTMSMSQPLQGGDYYINIGSQNHDEAGDGFQWSLGTPTGGVQRNRYDGLGWQPYGQNVGTAYRLSGQVVPEPTSMAVLGLGVLAALQKRRRKEPPPLDI
jgi:PEP-CTERM motif